MLSIFKKLDKGIKGKKGKEKLNKNLLIRYTVYRDSLNFKIRSAYYSLDTIEYLTSGQSKNDDLPFLIAYFIEHFFVSLYSCYDILAQIINTVLKLGENENKVDFKTISKVISDKRLSNYIGKKIIDHSDFKKFEKYRHCISHRRIPYSSMEEVTKREISGYVTYDTTDTSGRTREKKIINVFLTSNPSSFGTRTQGKLEVKKYGKEIAKWTEGKIAHVLDRLTKLI